MVIAPVDTRGEIAAMVEAVESGKLGKNAVDDRCRRILFYKYLLGLPLQDRIGDIDEAVAEVSVGAPAVKDSITNALRRHMNRNPRR